MLPSKKRDLLIASSECVSSRCSTLTVWSTTPSMTKTPSPLHRQPAKYAVESFVQSLVVEGNANNNNGGIEQSDDKKENLERSINSTERYNNLDPNMRYHEQPSAEITEPPSLPPKAYKAAKSPRTGSSVIPVSEGVLSSSPISPNKIQRSLSARSSPLLNGKFATVNLNTDSAYIRANRFNRRGRSPISDMHPRRNRCKSVTTIDGGNNGMRKAPSVRSLRDRIGSESSLSSVEAEQLGDDLKLLYEYSIKQRRKEQFAADKEKQRLDKILQICEDLMTQSKETDAVPNKDADFNKLLMAISLYGEDKDFSNSDVTVVSQPDSFCGIFSLSMTSSTSCSSPHKVPLPPCQSSNDHSRTLHRLPSLVKDIYSQNSLEQLQTRGKPTSPSPTEVKVRKYRPEDIAKIQLLYEKGPEKMEKLQHIICHLEAQLDECVIEPEMEKALVDSELQSERELLKREEQQLEECNGEIIDLEEKYMKQRDIKNAVLEKEKKNLLELEKRLEESQKQLNSCPESIRDIWEVELRKDQNVLERHLKNFEDIEFHTLENLSRMDEEKESKQKELLERRKKIDSLMRKRKISIQALTAQLDELIVQDKLNNQRLHMQRDEAIKELQEHQEKTPFLQQKYCELAGEIPTLPDKGYSIRTKSQSTIIAKKKDSEDSSGRDEPDQSVTMDWPATSSMKISPIFKMDGHIISDCNEVAGAPKSVFGMKLYHQRLMANNPADSHSEIQRWKGVDALSTSSMGSLDTTAYAWSNLIPIRKEIEQTKRVEKQLIEAEAKKQRLLTDMEGMLTQAPHLCMSSYANRRGQGKDRMNSDLKLAQSLSSPTVTTNAPTTTTGTSRKGVPLPASPPTFDLTSAESNDVKFRQNAETKNQTRPMTRYLPVRSKNFDLREHVESCGHSPDTCHHVSVTATACRGYLMKLGSRIKIWKKRWFVLDRQKKVISYYHNKHESKLKGMIYFQDVEDVFFDHLKMHRSPNPALAFCMKCYDRTYTLVAPSPEALRIWMDAIVTAAEGYTEYMKTFE